MGEDAKDLQRSLREYQEEHLATLLSTTTKAY
jgi:hypothetical protein